MRDNTMNRFMRYRLVRQRGHAIGEWEIVRGAGDPSPRMGSWPNYFDKEQAAQLSCDSRNVRQRRA